jgi:hypothetical protein
MKRIFALTLVIMLAIVSLGFCADNNWGNTDTEPLLRKVVPTYLLHSGVDFGGLASIASSVTTIPTAYSIVRYADSAAVGQVCTLAAGSKGQMLTIILNSRTGSNTIVITPATCTGFTTVTLDAAKEYITVLYVDSTVGWIVIGGTGTVA